MTPPGVNGIVGSSGLHRGANIGEYRTSLDPCHGSGAAAAEIRRVAPYHTDVLPVPPAARYRTHNPKLGPFGYGTGTSEPPGSSFACEPTHRDALSGEIALELRPELLNLPIGKDKQRRQPSNQLVRACVRLLQHCCLGPSTRLCYRSHPS